VVQANFSPIDDSWKKDAEKIYTILSSQSLEFIKKMQLNGSMSVAKILFSPFTLIAKV